MYLMAHQLLGRSIQPAYLFISHCNSFFSHPPPILLPSLFSLTQSSSKHCVPYLKAPHLPSNRSLLCTATSQTPAALIKNKQQQQFQLPFEDVDDEDDSEYEVEGEYFEEEEEDGGNEELGEENKEVVSTLEKKQSIISSKISSKGIPQLTAKEKKQLNSYAQSLGKKLTCHQVGKSGVTSSVEISISDALEANELIKFKVHGTCPDEPDAVASQLQEATRSVVVGHIGRTFILYRPSRRKAAPTETKKPPPRPQKLQRRRIAKPTGW
ncbi:hypothetical protein KI387_006746, partial [Taxus chinensis]